MTDLFALWGRLLGRLLGLPTIMCYPVFATHPEFRDPPHSKLQLLRTPRQTLGHWLRVQRYFKQLKATYNLPFNNPEELLIGAQTTTCLVFTAKELQPQLELFGDNYHFVGPSLDETVRMPFPDFPYDQLTTGRPVVYISLGSVLNDARFYRQCIQAFEKTPYTIVLNIGPRFAKRDFPAPASIIVCNYTPQLEVLEQASVFITHGGMNSAQESIYHEVPMLVIPQVSDQFLVAQVVQARELGQWLPKRKVTPKRLRQATQALLKNSTVKRNLAQASHALKSAGGYAYAADVVLETISV